MGRIQSCLLRCFKKFKQQLCPYEKQRLRHYEQDLQFDKIIATLINKRNAEELLTEIMDSACQLMQTEHGYIYLVSADSTYLEVKFAKGYYLSMLGKKLVKGESLSGKIWQTGKYIVTHDDRQIVDQKQRQKRIIVHGWIGLPLQINDQVVGVFCLAFIGQNNRFEAEDVQLLQRFAGLASVSLGNAQLYTKLQQELEEKRKVNDELRLAAKVYETALEGIIVTDADANIIQVNPAFSIMTGYSPEEICGKNVNLLWSGRHDQCYYGVLHHSLDQNGSWQGEIWNKRKNGSVFPQWLSISAIYDERGQTCQYVAIYSDITERKQYEEKLEYRAHYDNLTGLPNRWLLNSRMKQLLAQTVEKNYNMAILFLDIDEFKQVNDTLGHACGDKLLSEVAQRMNSILRVSDTLGRLGGDEFVVLLPQIRSPLDAGNVAQKMCDCFEHPFIILDQEIYITCSIGIGVYPMDGKNFAMLLERADKAMYRAKEKGKNHYAFFNSELYKNYK